MTATDTSGAPDADGFAPFESALWPVMQYALEALVIVDGRQRIAAVNLAAGRLFGHRTDWLLGQSLDVLIPPAYRDGHRQLAARFAASRQLHQVVRGPRAAIALRADGTELQVRVSLSRIDLPAPAQMRSYYAALLTGVDDEPPSSRALERFEQRVQSVFELLPVAVTIADGDRLVFANSAARRLFQRPDPLVGQSFCSLLDESSRPVVRERIAQCAAGDPDFSVIHGRVRKSDGTVREVEITVAMMPDHGQTTMQMVLADVTDYRRRARELQRSGETLRRLSASVVEAREQERRRIARELHDELGQQLTALKIGLSNLSDGASMPSRIGDMQTMLDDTIASVRRISADLRPMMLDDLGLDAAIEWLARDATQRLGFAIALRLEGFDPSIDERLATAIYRMVQEALTNAARHAGATALTIALRHEGGQLVLTITDNGAGYPPDAMHRHGSYGLLGIRERAAMFGGSLQIDNPPAGGARLVVRIPLAAAWPAGPPGSPP